MYRPPRNAPDGQQQRWFDLVSCQFAFHYCFESEAQAHCMIRNAAECLKPGGFFFGTTPCARTILSRVNKAYSETTGSGKAKFGNSVYSVEFEEESNVAQKLREKGEVSLEDLPAFGNQYNFHLEGVVDCPEFLVNFKVQWIYSVT